MIFMTNLSTYSCCPLLPIQACACNRIQRSPSDRAAGCRLLTRCTACWRLRATGGWYPEMILPYRKDVGRKEPAGATGVVAFMEGLTKSLKYFIAQWSHSAVFQGTLLTSYCFCTSSTLEDAVTNSRVLSSLFGGVFWLGLVFFLFWCDCFNHFHQLDNAVRYL